MDFPSGSVVFVLEIFKLGNNFIQADTSYSKSSRQCMKLSTLQLALI